ncbi:hypothetical protein AAFF_G00273400 [Aldrovandia affinis]|uniref:Secreted protein n=1 Tax=Aldrovandia affinis TaxID=143900 RepID=A0AAD7SRV5_9TELE|nr:hypothetical protein AAFF_G00273400 [Aldrovandia affinis]
MLRITMVMCFLGLCASIPVLDEHKRTERSASYEGFRGFGGYYPQPPYPINPYAHAPRVSTNPTIRISVSLKYLPCSEEPVSTMHQMTLVMCFIGLIGLCSTLTVTDSGSSEVERTERSASYEPRPLPSLALFKLGPFEVIVPTTAERRGCQSILHASVDVLRTVLRCTERR